MTTRVSVGWLVFGYAAVVFSFLFFFCLAVKGQTFWLHLQLQEWSAQPTATAMDLKERRHRSLTRGHCEKELQFTTSSLDSEECHVPTQKSYSSSETLKAFDHEGRLPYGGCMSDLVHHEADEYSRQGGGESTYTLHMPMHTHICSPNHSYRYGSKFPTSMCWTLYFHMNLVSLIHKKILK